MEGKGIDQSILKVENRASWKFYFNYVCICVCVYSKESSKVKYVLSVTPIQKGFKAIALFFFHLFLLVGG